MRLSKIIFAFFFLLLSTSADANLPSWAQRVREIRLENGMKFLLYPRGEAPIFTAYIRFRAGGMDEEEGKTGLAHFLEHMAFKGTTTIGTRDWSREKPILDAINRTGERLAAEYAKGASTDLVKVKALRDELKRLHDEQLQVLEKEELAKKMLERGGSDYNATTSKDMTTYFVSLPSQELRFWAETESARIFRPVFREFYEEKDVVLEERRTRVDDDPDGRLYEAFLGKAFEKGPYRWPTIGAAEDILKLTVSDLEKFWLRYYDPANAVGTIVGRFNMGEAEKILNETFGKVRWEQATLPKAKTNSELVQTQERKAVLKLPARPRILVGYHKPTLPEEDDYVFDLLDQILGDGRSSRLYRALVVEKKLVSSVSTSPGVPGSRLPNLFMIEMSPLRPDSEAVLEALEEELAKIRNEGVTDQELQKAKNRLTVDLLWQLKTNEGLASQLSYFEIVAGSWKYAADYLEKIGRFTPEDVRRVAQKYLNKPNRAIAVLEPSGK